MPLYCTSALYTFSYAVSTNHKSRLGCCGVPYSLDTSVDAASKKENKAVTNGAGGDMTETEKNGVDGAKGDAAVDRDHIFDSYEER